MLYGLVIVLGALAPVQVDAGKAQPASKPAAGLRAFRQAERERAFEEQLTGATFRGAWQMTEPGPDGDRRLGTSHPDRYSIASAEKIGDEDWLITARIQFDDKDVSLPVAVRVLWAGETPVITLDNAGLPGLGTYSARVVIHDGFYAGTWSGGGHGGVLSGQIVREKRAPHASGDAKSPAAATRPRP